ncbi:hypothetical protein DFH06DRAFT_1467382 [Mycena polygramma]|nr:hypothetical protein DFH06DRAFT_1467382 [Mycena polygramma]
MPSTGAAAHAEPPLVRQRSSGWHVDNRPVPQRLNVSHTVGALRDTSPGCVAPILDILELICEQIAQEDVFYGRNPELASLARTSKIFLDPALNALWREQETICNLLKCMPDDVWRISARGGGVYSQHLEISQVRTITAADWQRPLFYLRRVRYFSMRAVIETPDFLDALIVEPPSPWDTATPIISSFVRGLMHLESLDVPSLDNLALAHLAELPSLTILAIKSDAPRSVSLQPHSEYKPFPALTRLTLPSILSAAALLTTFPGCSLVSLSIFSGQSHSTKDHARQFYSALVNHCSYFSLRRIAVWRGEVTPIPNEQYIYAVGGDIIEPLFSFANLTSVSLLHPAGLDFDDTTILRLARAVTLEGLYNFAKHCRRLCELEMSFDATVVPKIRHNGKKRKSQESLTYLNVSLSPLREPRALAKFLLAIFPCLSEIGTWYDDICEDDDDDEDNVDPDVIASHRLWKNVETEL